MHHEQNAVIFDLDMTLVDTSALFEMRKKRLWREAYKNFDKTRVYDGISRLLQELKTQYKLGIVTSSPRTYAERLISFHNIEIQILNDYHDTKMHKPNPAPIIQGCLKLGAKPHEVYSIGDELTDVDASNSAGTVSILVSWGNAATVKCSAKYHCKTVEQLQKLLLL